MNRCSGCGYLVPGAWTECRRCGSPVAAATPATPTPPAAPIGAPHATTIGALALAAPPPPTPLPGTRARAAARGAAEAGFGAPDDALLAGAAPRDIGPDTMLPRVAPVITAAPSGRPSRLNRRSVVVAAVVLVCVLGAASSLIQHGDHRQTAQPVILAPQPPFVGIPTSLSAIVRIEAESSRHTALGNIMSEAGPSGAAVTDTQLASAQPEYQWVPANQPSTTNLIISVASVPGADQIAVSGTNREICAFGRWSPSAGATYVTMDHVSMCDADAAPTTGWSPLAGGSAQDLPNEDGN
ncbi:MAG: hypothetical protein ACLPVY_24410 [Acidimicrobiia bacterium]